MTIGLLAEKIGVAGAKSQKRIYRKATGKWETILSPSKVTKAEGASERLPADKSSDKAKNETKIDYRKNEMEIQMLSARLYEQVFRNTVPRTSRSDAINR